MTKGFYMKNLKTDNQLCSKQCKYKQYKCNIQSILVKMRQHQLFQ